MDEIRRSKACAYIGSACRTVSVSLNIRALKQINIELTSTANQFFLNEPMRDIGFGCG